MLGILTLGDKGGGKRVWREYSVEGHYDAMWLTRLWYTQAEDEGVVQKFVWH
jgi:hypothetical protein